MAGRKPQANRMRSRQSRKRRSPAQRWQRLGQLVGQALGGLVVVVLGIGLGLAAGVFRTSPPLPVQPVAPAAVQPAVQPVTAMVDDGAGEEPAEPAMAPIEARSEPPPPTLPPAPAPPAELPPPVPPPAPVVGEQPAWLRYAVPFVLPTARPMIALVFDDLGLDRRRTDRVIALPPPLTLSFLPYAADLPHQTKVGRAAGHELMVHLPMEPLAAHLDPGPGALLTNLSPAENLRRLDHGLAAFDGYVGINNHMGSRFTSDRAMMTPVLTELRRRGLLFLDSVTTPGTVGSAVAASLTLPHTRRQVFLDDDPAPAAIQASLARLEQHARQSGSAVGIGHPRDTTLEAVSAWLPAVVARGFVMVPVSAIVRAENPHNGGGAVPAAISIRKANNHG